MQKGNKGKLRPGTANNATIGLGGPWRSRNDELRPWVFTFYFARSVFTFGLGFPALRFSHLRFIFKLRESLKEMEILIKHFFLHLFLSSASHQPTPFSLVLPSLGLQKVRERHMALPGGSLEFLQKWLYELARLAKALVLLSCNLRSWILPVRLPT